MGTSRISRRLSPPVGACRKCRQTPFFHTLLSCHYFPHNEWAPLASDVGCKCSNLRTRPDPNGALTRVAHAAPDRAGPPRTAPVARATSYARGLPRACRAPAGDRPCPSGPARPARTAQGRSPGPLEPFERSTGGGGHFGRLAQTGENGRCACRAALVDGHGPRCFVGCARHAQRAREVAGGAAKVGVLPAMNLFLPICSGAYTWLGTS